MIPALIAWAVYYWWPEIEGRAVLISLSEEEEQARLEAARLDMWFGDFEAAIATLEPMAYGGLTEAQSLLGRLNVDSRNPVADGEEGYAWLERAAAKADNLAQIEIAFLNAAGGGSEAERKNALAKIYRFGDQDEAYALSTLALMHRRGLGIQEDYAKAADFALEASQLGRPNAAYHLLAMYLSRRLPPSKQQFHILAGHWFALWDATGDLLVMKTLLHPPVLDELSEAQKAKLDHILATAENRERLEADDRFWSHFNWSETARSALSARDDRSVIAIAHLWYATQLAIDQTAAGRRWGGFYADFVIAKSLSDRRLIARGQSLAASWLSGERLYPDVSE
jgi:hypothetical protein